MIALKRPWYQEPLVWLVIFFPASAVFGGMATIYLAISSDDGLVVDDYYKEGLEINRTLARDTAAKTHGLSAVLDINLEAHLIHVYLNAPATYQLPEAINVSFHHHTRSGFDQEMILKHAGDNIYQGTLPELIFGDFSILLAAEDWRLLKSVNVPLTSNP